MELSTVISVTGTKGKTTVTTVLATVLRELTTLDTLLVTTSGHYVNGEQRSTLGDSKRAWGLVPSNAPGRFLYETLAFKERGVAVLEASLGSSSINGIGYSWHEIGVFLNVYKDHIGSSERLKNQADIVKAKKFIFERIRDNGWAIYNADDSYVCSALSYIRENVKRISFGIKGNNLVSDCHVYLENHIIWYRNQTQAIPIISTTDVVWTFNGTFTPSVYNLMAVIASVIAYYNGVVPPNLATVLARTRLPQYSGRLTILTNTDGVKVLVDYAHEEESLKAVGCLGRALCNPSGRVIGIVRLAYDRSDKHITETAHGIAKSFDHFIVYDKIDGHHVFPKEHLQSKRFKQVVGMVSQKLTNALLEAGATVDRVVREDEALQHAARLAEPGDVVVFIVNDNIEQSINWVREYFNADFL